MTDGIFPDDKGDESVQRLKESEIRRHWPAALAELMDVLEVANRRVGHNADRARVDAFRSVRAIARHLGGRMVYLPKGRRLDQALRDREIWERHNGRNVRELAREYELTEVRIYEILRDQRALARSRDQ